MGILAQHSFTVRRLIDGKTLNFFLKSNQPLTQVYTPDPATYSPNYPASPYLVITPSLVLSGVSGDQISKLKAMPTWKINGTTIGSTLNPTYQAQVATSSPYALTVKKNMESVSQMHIECEAIYVEPVSLVETPVSTTMTFTKNSNTGAILWGSVWSPESGVIMDGIQDSVTLKAELKRGSVIVTAATYTWYKQNGANWEQITSANANGITGYTTANMTVPAQAVLNTANFKCVIKDNESGSSTYNQTVSAYYAVVDHSDPFMIEVDFPQGDGIVSGGSTKVRIEVRQGATRKDSAFFTGKTIKIFRFTATGVLDTTWGTSGYKNPDSNRELTIAEADLLTGKAQTAFGVELHG